ncbi:MAG TPA: hypothetical protein VFY04_10355 [Solirubrobacterales bacterium]|nr:hypothetical protein [Solirubrobacterales bacterium]
MDLSDVGKTAVVGGVLAETGKRLAAKLGWRWNTDAWREGMFVSGLGALLFWAFRKLVA